VSWKASDPVENRAPVCVDKGEYERSVHGDTLRARTGFYRVSARKARGSEGGRRNVRTRATLATVKLGSRVKYALSRPVWANHSPALTTSSATRDRRKQHRDGRTKGI
jgi:hypothetical protein